MNLRIENGALCCPYKSYGITNLKAKIEYRGDKHNMLEINSGAWVLSQSGNQAQSAVAEGVFTVTAKKTNGGVALSLSFRAAKDFAKRKCYRLILNGFLPVRAQALQFNHTQVADRVRDFEMGSKSLGMGLIANQREEASQYLAFKAKGGVYGVLGFVTFENFFGEIAFNENGEFEMYANLEENEVCGGDLIKTDECWICVQRGNADILSLYGKQIAKKHGVAGKCELPTGWCSWYYYGPNISQEKILENMREAKVHELPIKYIQIDDGWQKCYGDWTENERFPMGMKALADQIKAAGYTPGIWVSPFLFAADSQTFKDNPEFFVRGANGEFHPNRLIDYSVKGARQWLYDLAHKLSVEWGYRYIKIDLVSYRLAKIGYKKKGFNAIKNFREAIKIMRSAVTPDTVFLTCTSPVGASAGIAECVRVSDDIFERWDSLKTVARQVFRRYYVSEYINLDPDCLMVRTKDKHDDETFRICVRDEREIKTFVNFMSASGGAVMLSDKFSLLEESDFEKIKTLFPINKTPAKPLDIFERDVPSILYYGNRGGLDMYAIFNWSNAVDTLKVPFGKEKFVKGYYSQAVERTANFQITLAPHDSEIIYVAEDESLFEKLGKSIMPNACD